MLHRATAEASRLGTPQKRTWTVSKAPGSITPVKGVKSNILFMGTSERSKLSDSLFSAPERHSTYERIIQSLEALEICGIQPASYGELN